MELNPHHNWGYPYNLGRGYYGIGDYEKALGPLAEAVERNPGIVYPQLYLAATYVRLGRMEDAEWTVTEIEVLAPDFTLSTLADVLSTTDDSASRLMEDLRAAGMQE